MKIETETEDMLPLVKECQDPPEAGRGEKEFSLRAFGRSMVGPTPGFQTSGLWNCERINYVLFQTTHLMARCYGRPKKLIQNMMGITKQLQKIVIG